MKERERERERERGGGYRRRRRGKRPGGGEKLSRQFRTYVNSLREFGKF